MIDVCISQISVIAYISCQIYLCVSRRVPTRGTVRKLYGHRMHKHPGNLGLFSDPGGKNTRNFKWTLGGKSQRIQVLFAEMDWNSAFMPSIHFWTSNHGNALEKETGSSPNGKSCSRRKWEDFDFIEHFEFRSRRKRSGWFDCRSLVP